MLRTYGVKVGKMIMRGTARSQGVCLLDYDSGSIDDTGASGSSQSLLFTFCLVDLTCSYQ